MKEVAGDELLRRPVRLHGIELGRPVDVLLDRGGFRAVGLDVVCGDGVHRFLPLPTAAVGADELKIHSPLVLLEEDELDFYRKRTLSLSSLRGRRVLHTGKDAGAFRDVVVSPAGDLLAVVLESGHRVVPDRSLAFAPRTRSAA